MVNHYNQLQIQCQKKSAAFLCVNNALEEKEIKEFTLFKIVYKKSSTWNQLKKRYERSTT